MDFQEVRPVWNARGGSNAAPFWPRRSLRLAARTEWHGGCGRMCLSSSNLDPEAAERPRWGRWSSLMRNLRIGPRLARTGQRPPPAPHQAGRLRPEQTDMARRGDGDGRFFSGKRNLSPCRLLFRCPRQFKRQPRTKAPPALSKVLEASCIRRLVRPARPATMLLFPLPASLFAGVLQPVRGLPCFCDRRTGSRSVSRISGHHLFGPETR